MDQSNCLFFRISYFSKVQLLLTRSVRLALVARKPLSGISSLSGACNRLQQQLLSTPGEIRAQVITQAAARSAREGAEGA